MSDRPGAPGRTPDRPTLRPLDGPRSPIRLAGGSDAAELAALHVAGWRAAYRGIVPDPVLDGLSVEGRTRWWRERLTIGETGLDRTWVIADANGLAGFATGGAARDESAPPPPGAGEVHAVYLRPDAVGRGLGRALFAWTVADLAARGFDPIVVWVFEANVRARRFYERAGFVADGVRAPIDFGHGVVVPEVRYRCRAATAMEAATLAALDEARPRRDRPEGTVGDRYPRARPEDPSRKA